MKPSTKNCYKLHEIFEFMENAPKSQRDTSEDKEPEPAKTVVDSARQIFSFFENAPKGTYSPFSDDLES